MKTRLEILDAVAKLLDAPDVVVRVQRELTAEQMKDTRSHTNFVTGKRVTFIISATQQ